jgi:hypothetical protein
MKLFRAMVILAALNGCSMTAMKQAPPCTAYGYCESNPIKVGRAAEGSGPRTEREYLDQLTGPAGQRVRYQRLGSKGCFGTPHGNLDCLPPYERNPECPCPKGMKTGSLDMYLVSYEGIAQPVTLYLNMYDREDPRAPEGFRIGKARAGVSRGSGCP